MSSEKRSMAPNTFDSEVPPLKSSISRKASIVKICLSVQHAQKSFSTMVADKPRWLAVSTKRSALRAASQRAILFKHDPSRFLSRLRRSSQHQGGRSSVIAVSRHEIERSSVLTAFFHQHPFSRGSGVPARRARVSHALPRELEDGHA